jgi:hypothetical protein
MAVGKCNGNTSAFVATSSDGITWTQQLGATSFATITDVAYISTGTLWVAISGSSLIYSSNNGASWSVTGTVPATTDIPYQLASNGTTTVAVYVNNAASSQHNVWYSTNGITWTAATNFQGNTNYGGDVAQSAMRGISWTGTHFLVSQTTCTQVTTDFNNWQWVGCQMNNPLGNGQGTVIKYSSAYTRYYSPAQGSANANKCLTMSGTSGDSKLWQWTTTAPAVQYCSIEVAGANTILIAKPTTSNTARAKSTDGVNFSAATDIRSYVGSMLGLGNGNFYSQQTDGGGGWYVSTDPTTLTGTTFVPNGAFKVSCGAADPISGAWVIQGDDNAGSSRQISGSTATTCVSSFQVPWDVTTYGEPRDIFWHASDSKFYCLAGHGAIFSATAANAVANTWTFLGFCYGSNPMSNSRGNIIVINNTIYVTTQASQNVIYVAPISTSLVFVTYTVPSMYGNALSAKSTTSNYPRGNPMMATNGTNIAILGSSSLVATIVPANNRNIPSSPPAGVARVDPVNGNQIGYGGNAAGSAFGGIYASSNYVTAFGYASLCNQNSANSTFPQYQRAGFAAGNYYVSLNTQSVIWSGSAITNFNTGAVWSGNTVAGVRSIQPNFLATDGTNLVYYLGANNSFYASKATPPQRLSATITLSAVEIT